MTAIEKKAAAVLGGIAAVEGAWVLVNVHASPRRFWEWTGFTQPAQAGVAGWGFALAVAILYVGYAARLPSVRRNLTSISVLKVLAFAVALGSAFCEEGIFRKVVIETLARHQSGVLLQVAASALSFGAVHAVWGMIKGSWRASLGAMLATGSLGLLLAFVYLSSYRSLAPCVASHFLINLFAEPGLVLAALSGEMDARHVRR